MASRIGISLLILGVLIGIVGIFLKIISQQEINNNKISVVNELPKDCNVGTRVLVKQEHSVVLYKCITKWEQQ